MKEFVEWSFEFHSDFTMNLWRSICDRLILPVDCTSQNRRLKSSRKVQLIDFNSSDPMEGIISYLSSECNGNIHTEGIVTITSSSSNCNYPHHLADVTDIAFFNSIIQPNQWFCYDFRDRRINLTRYAVGSYCSETYNPRSWAGQHNVSANDQILQS
jgi:hypothetical protein